MNKYEMTPYNTFIAKSRYARYLDTEKRRENWNETVDRYFDFMIKYLKSKQYNISNELINELKISVLNLQVLPSMRGIMTAGAALERQNVAQFNCAYLPIDDVKSFDELMYILLCGTGVGYSVEQRYINKLPEVPEKLYDSDTTIVVSDSKEGWAKALRQLIALLYSGEIPKFDFSKIRPAGARLKTFGGRASGPEPLKELFNFCILKFKTSVGKKLSSLDCHDICCKVADVVVVGGVRRSAMISLSDLSDDRIAHAKSGQWWLTDNQRALANNSAVYETKPSVGQFIREWSSLYESKSGERGIFNREASLNQVLKNERRDGNYLFGTNPCCEIILRPYQFCVSGDTKLITRNGVTNIKDAVDNEIEIWNGEEWSKVSPYKTGEADILHRVHFSDGSYLDATNNHKFLVKSVNDKEFKEVETLDLIELLKVTPRGLRIPRSNILYLDGNYEKSAYNYGFILGNGFLHKTCKKPLANLYNEDKKIDFEDVRIIGNYYNYNNEEFTTISFDEVDLEFSKKLKYEDGLPSEIFSWDEKSIINFVSGWADADGCQAFKGIRIYGNESKIRDGQLLLSKIGINSSVNLMSKKGTSTNLRVRKNDVWYLQITTTAKLNTKRLITNNTDIEKFKGKYQLIKNIETLDGYHESFCLTEDKLNQCVFNNVLTKQCNLTTCVIRSEDTFEDIKNKIRLATILGTFQSTLTDFPYLRKVWQKNTEEERLLGVSMTGVLDNKLLNNSDLDGLPNRLIELKEIAINVNKEFSELLNIQQSAAITCIKPEGTTSQLTSVASGLHPQYSKYYIRTVRADNKDPLTKFMKEKGFVNEACVMKPENTTIFSFPVKAPDGSVLKDDIDAISHLELWLIYQRYYCEHKPSVTVTVKEDEWLKVGAWVYEHFNELTGVSFMPADLGTYKQAPYTECSEEDYLNLLEKTPTNINWNDLIEVDDNIEGAQMLSCSAGVCEI